MRPEALRFHDTLEGRGSAYDGERRLAEVDYLLKVVEEAEKTARAADGSFAVVPGERGIYGVVKSPVALHLGDYIGTRLVLRLQDDRRLDFTVVKVSGKGVFLVQGLGDVR